MRINYLVARIINRPAVQPAATLDGAESNSQITNTAPEDASEPNQVIVTFNSAHDILEVVDESVSVVGGGANTSREGRGRGGRGSNGSSNQDEPQANQEQAPKGFLGKILSNAVNGLGFRFPGR